MHKSVTQTKADFCSEVLITQKGTEDKHQNFTLTKAELVHTQPTLCIQIFTLLFVCIQIFTLPFNCLRIFGMVQYTTSDILPS